jgi:hypothetical protein
MALPTSSLSFSTCSVEIGNTAPIASDNLSADILFGDNWTTDNTLSIRGYGQTQNSGADRIATLPAGSGLGLSNYLGLNVLGNGLDITEKDSISYWSIWDNQLTGGDDNFSDVYLKLWDSTKTYQLTIDSLGNLPNSTNTGYTNIGINVPLVQYAYWEVGFQMTAANTDPITFELQCSLDNGNGFTSIFTVTNSFQYGTWAYAWNDSGDLSVETADPTKGYVFQMLFYP